VLLDTHVVLWWLAGRRDRLSAPMIEALSRPQAKIVVSAVVLWEAAIKRSLGKLVPPTADLLARLEAVDVELLPIAPRHADHVAGLPWHHRDPFDRLLVAQAQLEGLTIVSADPWIDAYDVPVLR
jgi:PIN domain nuclease of toxin-antitoxin system